MKLGNRCLLNKSGGYFLKYLLEKLTNSAQISFSIGALVNCLMVIMLFMLLQTTLYGWVLRLYH